MHENERSSGSPTSHGMSTDVNPAQSTGDAQALRDLLPRLEALEAQLTTVITRYAGTPAAADSASAPVAEESGEGEKSEEGEENEDAPASRMSIVVSLLAVFATLVMIAVTFYQMQLDPGAAAIGGATASFNEQLVQNMNTGEMYTQYRAYTDYTLNRELQSELERALADSENATPEQQAALRQELVQAQRKAAASSLFFPQRYLNRDGSYAVERQLGEAWSSAEQQMDLVPEPHYDDADSQRSVWMQIMWLLLWLTVALCIYEIINYLHEQRKVLRFSFVTAATLTVIAIAVLTYVMMQMGG